MSITIYQNKKDIAFAMFNKLVMLSHLKRYPVHIALSGGETPKIIFSSISKLGKNSEIKWENLHFWWCDERCVDHQNPESNFGEANRLLFQNFDIPKDNIHPIQGNISPEISSHAYLNDLKEYLPRNKGLPQFDWVWLGIGSDGHVSSIFPQGVSLTSNKWVELAAHPVTEQRRITLTLKVINNSKSIDLLVTGKSKENILAKVFKQKISSLNYPVKAVKLRNGRSLAWHLDWEAASKLIFIQENHRELE